MLIVLIVLYVDPAGLEHADVTPTMDQTQRRMMMAMPLFFVVLRPQLPGGRDRLLDHDEHLDDAQQYLFAEGSGP